MARKISFDELHELVANIDYVWDESFPIAFSVKNGKEVCKFECGITGEFEFQGELFDEYQYLVITDDNGFKTDGYLCDLYSPDSVSNDEIEERLKSCCSIDENSVITFYDGKSKSLNGKKKYDIDTEYLPSSFIESVTQNDLTDEVKKGLDWLKKVVGENRILFSTKKGEYVDLNEMSGSTFAFMFDRRKVLYYDICFDALCTYAPYYGWKDLKHYCKRIECNDYFKWVLLYICTGENLLSSFKPCNVKVTEIDGVERYFDEINHEKMEGFLEKLVNDTLTEYKVVNGEEITREEVLDKVNQIKASIR